MVVKILTFWQVDLKFLESLEMWCWKRMEIIWTDRLKD